MESENLFRTFYEQTLDLFLLMDLKGKIIGCNPAFSKFLGYAEDELCTKTIYDLFLDDSDFTKESMKVLQTDGYLPNAEFGLQKKNGSIIPVLGNIVLLKDETDTPFAYHASLRDVTSFQQAKAKLKEKEQEIELHTQQLADFINVASHELRTPIQPILNYAELAHNGQVSQDEALHVILKNAIQLTSLTNDILEVSRIERGSLKYHFKKTNLSNLLYEIVKNQRTKIKGDPLIKLRTNPGVFISGDDLRLSQAINNIIDNAIKFTKKGSITVSQKMTDNRVIVTIKDTGIGIPEEILTTCFDRFVTKDVGDLETKGTGLGLYITKSIIDAHNGEISVFNNNDGGATFVISLPSKQNKRMK